LGNFVRYVAVSLEKALIKREKCFTAAKRAPRVVIVSVAAARLCRKKIKNPVANYEESLSERWEPAFPSSFL
jgi:hypothetical protein